MPHLTLYDQLGDMPILGAIVGRPGSGSELVGRQGPIFAKIKSFTLCLCVNISLAPVPAKILCVNTS